MSLRHAAVSLAFARTIDDQTSERVALDRLGIEHADGEAYVPSPWWVLHWLLPRSEVKPSDVFVEYGCGKGRVVVAAARRYPFAEVIGVELSAELAATARDLVTREKHLRADAVRIEAADAAAFDPPDPMTHAYMFNPFRGETMQRVLSNMIASLDRAPRRLRLIYLNPEEHETLLATGRFQIERRARIRRLRVDAAVYTAQ
jgi:SAM-dependent methyltransferase